VYVRRSHPPSRHDGEARSPRKYISALAPIPQYALDPRAPPEQGYAHARHEPEEADGDHVPDIRSCRIECVADRTVAAADGSSQRTSSSRSAAAELSLVGMSGNRLSDQFGGWARLVPATPVDHVNAAGSDEGRVEHLYRGPFVGG
jgi:hypothetical protein